MPTGLVPPLSIEKTQPGYRPLEGWSANDAIYGLATLVLCALLTQSIWTLYIRPHAATILGQAVIVTNADKARHAVRQLRSIFVILKDYEQETSITLTLWSFLLLARQAQAVRRARELLARDFTHAAEERVILPDDARSFSRVLENLSPDVRDMFLPRLLGVALNRFGATRSVQDAAEAIRDECEFEVSSYDAKLSMVRFTAWAIPAVGFVGTVRGIGAALQEAQGAMGGDISGVTLGLGVTFNSTLTALVCCIFVMFFLHQLQQAQDRIVLDSRTYADRKLLRRMRAM